MPWTQPYVKEGFVFLQESTPNWFSNMLYIIIGSSFGYRFGSWSDLAVERSAQSVRERLGRKPNEVFAVGDAKHIVDRLGQYVAAGASKFILRPIADGDADILAQSKMLINEILPEIKRLNVAH